MAAQRQVTAWVNANGLSLHPDKTKVSDRRQPAQGFDFLGYRFEAGMRFGRAKSLRALKDKVRARTMRSRGGSLARIVADINRIPRGGLVTSNTPDRTCSAGLTVSSGGGCAPFRVSRSSVPAGADVRPLGNGPMPSSRDGGCSPYRQPSARETLPMRKPATGESCAGEPPARFGGREGDLPDPYRGTCWGRS